MIDSIQTSNDATFASLTDELDWRGLIKDRTDETELNAALNEGRIAFYTGFDPTAPSLHVGNLLQIILMRRLQNAGHTPVALIGGATGLIGDPRPHSERELQEEETVEEWTQKLTSQLETLFPATSAHNKVRFVNNFEWTKNLTAIHLLRDIGKHFRVNDMVNRTSVKTRLESEEGISFTEFTYMLLQANDFLNLARTHNCVLQTGGSDQWGNLLAGVQLAKKVDNRNVHALTTPLVTNSDGTKFGKSEGNAIWLNAGMLSPFKFFQFWLNTSDEDVEDRLRKFTFLSREQTMNIMEAHKAALHARKAQHALALQVTAFVHGEATARLVKAVSEDLFTAAAETLTPSQLNVIWDEIPNTTVDTTTTVIEALKKVGVGASSGEVRRLIKQGGLKVNGHVLQEEALFEPLKSAVPQLADGSFLIRSGKRRTFIIR